MCSIYIMWEVIEGPNVIYLFKLVYARLLFYYIYKEKKCLLSRFYSQYQDPSVWEYSHLQRGNFVVYGEILKVVYVIATGYLEKQKSYHCLIKVRSLVATIPFKIPMFTKATFIWSEKQQNCYNWA